jgi:SAM-dependent methyltransferase
VRTHAQVGWAPISPSPTLLKFAGNIAASASGAILDVACGSGRNAIALAAHGCDIVCLDRDLSRLRQLQTLQESLLAAAPLICPPWSIIPVCANVSKECWPFLAESFDTIISVHFVKMELLPSFLFSLKTKGYLYFETFGGHGQN